jgi:AraC family transcriptional activator of pobA
MKQASSRITLLFMEMLENQFPIGDTGQRMQLRTASEFARQLDIHVNYLNKVLKDTTGKTTTENITERILQEARLLLRNTDWNVSDIALTLGFNEIANFNNLFRREMKLSPTKYRSAD